MSRSDRGVGGRTGRLRLEPNDTVRLAHNDGEHAIAHNPRKRGDGVLVISTTEGSRQKSRSFDQHGLNLTTQFATLTTMPHAPSPIIRLRRRWGVIGKPNRGSRQKKQVFRPTRLEPNDTVRYAHNDGARAIAHNPRKRGDGALVISTTGIKQKRTEAKCLGSFLAPPVGLEPTTP